MAMGITIASYSYRWRQPSPLGFGGIEGLIRHSAALGAGGLQVGIDARWDAPHVRAIRRQLETGGLYIEGQVSLPHDERGLDRFRRQIELARDLGASIVRTVCLGGRRYETFRSAEAWAAFLRRSTAALEGAEPVVRRHRLRLAVENHKDWRVDGLLSLLRHLDSEWIGVCVDTGNSISLLEDPMEVIRHYAPWAFTTHLKDMALQEDAEGFLLSEVPLGEGILDLKEVRDILRKARPGIEFNLEMITRNPLKVPCLAPSYWATFRDLPARALARTLALARARADRPPLPTVEGLAPRERIAVEEEHVRRSFRHARDHLRL